VTGTGVNLACYLKIFRSAITVFELSHERQHQGRSQPPEGMVVSGLCFIEEGVAVGGDALVMTLQDGLNQLLPIIEVVLQRACVVLSRGACDLSQGWAVDTLGGKELLAGQDQGVAGITVVHEREMA
jgi:hypothetical protein